MNHEQAMLMKSSRVSDLNTPWEQVLHLASRRVFPKRHTIDVSNTESPYFYYILSGTVRLAYVGANGEERTILYAGAGTLMNVPTIIAGDIKNTVVTCTERVEAAIFDAGLLTDRAFAAAHPDLLLNLIHSLCRMGLPRHERHHQQLREGHQRPRPALYGQVPPLDEIGPRYLLIQGTHRELTEGNGPPFVLDLPHIDRDILHHLQYDSMPGDKETWNDYCALCFMAAVWLMLFLKPGLAPRLPKSPLHERMASLKTGLPIMGIFFHVIGGIYGGVFTATEGGGIGARHAAAHLRADLRAHCEGFRLGSDLVRRHHHGSGQHGLHHAAFRHQPLRHEGSGGRDARRHVPLRRSFRHRPVRLPSPDCPVPPAGNLSPHAHERLAYGGPA